jgi:4-hydroxy-tetrahydrodipicolinate reductase
MRRLRVCIAGATGWTGRALVTAVLDAPDLALGSAVSRAAAGRDLGEALGGDVLGVPVHASVREALDGIDVLIDYTSATAVKANALAAIDAGVAVVIGSSGLTAADFGEIDAAARERSVGVVASGNFSLTAAMTPGARPSPTSPARCSPRARRPGGSASRAGSTRCCWRRGSQRGRPERPR